VLRLLVQLGVRIAHADEGSLLVLDEPANELVFAMTIGNSESERTLVGQRVPVGQGITGLAVMTREVQIGSPTFKDLKQPRHLDGDPRSVLAAPMIVGDAVLGAMTAVTLNPDVHFGSREAELYAGFASVAAVVVQQRQRLAMYEQTGRESTSQAQLSEREKAETSIFQSLERILQTGPEATTHVAALLTAVEKIVGTSS
jgi:sigma-B regulation protein RsbU (phosphoserine phosphatase)